MPLSDSLARRMMVGLLVGDVRRHLEAASRSSVRRDDRGHRAVGRQLGRRDGLGRVDHLAHRVLGDEPGQVGGGAERAPVDLGQAEGGVLGGHHDVGVAGQADPAAQAEALDGGDDRHLAVVDGGEGGGAAPVDPDQGLVALGLDLLDVHPGAEPPPSARSTTTRSSGTRPAASRASARANQPATSRALTGGRSMTTSAIPSCAWITSMGMDASVSSSSRRPAVRWLTRG